MQDTDQEVAPQKKNKNKKSPARIKLRGICSTHRYGKLLSELLFWNSPIPDFNQKKVRYKGKKKKAWSANDYYLNKSVETPVESKSPSNRQASFKSSWTRRKSTHNAPFFFFFLSPGCLFHLNPQLLPQSRWWRGEGEGVRRRRGVRRLEESSWTPRTDEITDNVRSRSSSSRGRIYTPESKVQISRRHRREVIPLCATLGFFPPLRPSNPSLPNAGNLAEFIGDQDALFSSTSEQKMSFLFPPADE